MNLACSLPSVQKKRVQSKNWLKLSLTSPWSHINGAFANSLECALVLSDLRAGKKIITTLAFSFSTSTDLGLRTARGIQSSLYMNLWFCEFYICAGITEPVKDHQFIKITCRRDTSYFELDIFVNLNVICIAPWGQIGAFIYPHPRWFLGRMYIVTVIYFRARWTFIPLCKKTVIRAPWKCQSAHYNTWIAVFIKKDS